MPASQQPPSLVRRIVQFFRENPHEMLTYPDIETKFDCTRQEAHMAVGQARQRGAVESMTMVCGKAAAPQLQEKADEL